MPGLAAAAVGSPTTSPGCCLFVQAKERRPGPAREEATRFYAERLKNTHIDTKKPQTRKIKKQKQKHKSHSSTRATMLSAPAGKATGACSRQLTPGQYASLALRAPRSGRGGGGGEGRGKKERVTAAGLRLGLRAHTRGRGRHGALIMTDHEHTLLTTVCTMPLSLKVHGAPPPSACASTRLSRPYKCGGEALPNLHIVCFWYCD